ncbi:MAG: AAA family ATPase [Deltaproteobacteria bacterium]|nr:AAA family ATPase [Deltaproteobacteria bacterium]
MRRIFPIGGGKGGSGKSFLTANLGALLARRGQRVLLVDLDLGGANLHTLLGVRNPGVGLDVFLERRCRFLEQVIVQTMMPGLHIIPSMNCSMEISNLFYQQKLKIIKAIRGIASYDYILLDLGAGTNFNTIDFFLISDEGLFVVTPEPTSIENTFRFIRAVYVRKIKQLLKQKEFLTVQRELQDQSAHHFVRTPSEIIDRVAGFDPEKGRSLQERLSRFRLRFILNQFRRHSDATLGAKIERVCNRHFHSTFHFLENVGYDERVHDSIATKDIYVNRYPYTSTAGALENIARKIAENGNPYPLPLEQHAREI